MEIRFCDANRFHHSIIPLFEFQNEQTHLYSNSQSYHSRFALNIICETNINKCSMLKTKCSRSAKLLARTRIGESRSLNRRKQGNVVQVDVDLVIFPPRLQRISWRRYRSVLLASNLFGVAPGRIQTNLWWNTSEI